VRVIRSKHLASIRDAYYYLGKASHIVLHGSGARDLKVDRSLIDPIMKFKADCLEIQEYMHVSQYDSLIDTSRMWLAGFTLLTPIKRLLDT
jgi:hypothetical protein